MSQPASGRLPYELDTIIRCTPPVSGVYALFSWAECVGVGASDDICASLLETYYMYDPRLDGKQFTHFTFDLVPPEHRVAQMTDRIRELRPLYTLASGSPEFSQRQFAQEGRTTDGNAGRSRNDTDGPRLSTPDRQVQRDAAMLRVQAPESYLAPFLRIRLSPTDSGDRKAQHLDRQGG